MTIEPFLLAGAGLVLVAVISSRVAGAFGVPALLLFMGVGMLAGSEGPGQIEFTDFELSQALGIGALALILFDGGISTSWRAVRPVLAPGLTLATVGVVATAGITGVAAAWVFDLPLEVGLLMGSIVSSTDAAAVFSILRTRRTGLAGGLQPLLELESGANDPMAAFLTIACIELITGDAGSWVDLVPMLVQQFAVGIVVGIGAGWLGQQVVNRIGLDTEGLYPAITLAVAFGTYGGAVLLGGSGFVAAYVCGLWIGNNDLLHKKSLMRFHASIAWLCQIAMFLVLGLLVFPSNLVEIAPESLLIVAVLVLVARPVASYVLLTLFRTPWRHQTLVAWVGLRGATPIVLATFPLVEGVPDAPLIFDIVFFVVLISVLLQGTTIDRFARLVGVAVPTPPVVPAPLEAGQPLPDGTSLRELEVLADSFADGRALLELHLPERALVVLVNRDGTYIVPTGATRLEAGDGLLLLAPDEAFLRCRDLLTAPAQEEP